ncbi:thaumatin family protein [Streptomyces hygroscopicus]|uniref:thaumatin family protein n=1 Tax=Streptomyces hygroscopicus TaxID=1912 RepID=UPI0022406551|nr:thaumatin family protein [Streptomyces hygroscopicus]
MRRILTIPAATVAAALAALAPCTGARPHTITVASVAAPHHVAAPADHTVTFVNHTGRKVWVGSTVNTDGSKNLSKLPTLEPGQSATVTVPENAAPGHWRGKFFARMGCTGNPGSTFHCPIGDCGKFTDHCDPTATEQPVGLAEFNFDTHDGLAPWYDVSYVNAFSVPITITPHDVTGSGSGCATTGCSQNLLPKCPAADLTRWPDGTPMLCTSPNRDAKTPYSDMIAANCPKAYGWSRQDQEPGNQVMQQCSRCNGFTVEFHRGA